MLPSRDLCDSEMTRSLEFGEVCSPVWIADPGDKKLGLNIHHCPGGWERSNSSNKASTSQETKGE